MCVSVVLTDDISCSKCLIRSSIPPPEPLPPSLWPPEPELSPFLKLPYDTLLLLTAIPVLLNPLPQKYEINQFEVAAMAAAQRYHPLCMGRGNRGGQRNRGRQFAHYLQGEVVVVTNLTRDLIPTLCFQK